MSFDTQERSQDNGAPVSLYEVRIGNNPDGWFRYTDATENIIVGTGTTARLFKSMPIQRDEIVASGVLDRASIEIRCPTDSEVAKLFQYYPPSYAVVMVIYDGHINDAAQEWRVVHSGTIVNYKEDQPEAVLTSDPIAKALARPGLRRNNQLQCPHVLYGTGCRAPKKLYPAQVSAIIGSNLIRVASGYPVEHFRQGGIVSWTVDGFREEVRNIWSIAEIAPSVQQFVVSGLVQGLSIGDTLHMIKGCRHTLNDCRYVHNNIPNYGGMPWIPNDNPIETFSAFL